MKTELLHSLPFWPGLTDSEKQQIVLFTESIAGTTLRRFNLELKKYIPAYMLPGRLISMEKLPYTANGKIDRMKLRCMIGKVN